MSEDEDVLRDLNIAIGRAECKGDRKFFERCLASTFAMSRAHGGYETRETFLDYLRPGPARSTDQVSVLLLGPNRAVVTCRVELAGTHYENHRVFVRESPSSDWKLLSWANEVTGSPGVRPPVGASTMTSLPGVYGYDAWSQWESSLAHARPLRDLAHTRHDSGPKSLEAGVPTISSYGRLVEVVSFLAVMNKNLTLLFRGQTGEHRLLPSLHRGSWPVGASGAREGRLAARRTDYWTSLASVEEQMLPVLQRAGLPRHRHVERSDIRWARWSVIQHYELWPTPMLDFSTSLRVAASFAFGPDRTKRGFLYVTGTRRLRSDLMPLRPKVGDDAAERRDGVLAIRLNAVCPPTARRPHLQDGVLLGVYPFDDHAALDPSRNDFTNRIIAKFELDNGDDRFWSPPDFSSHTPDALLPPDDPFEAELRGSVSLRDDF